MPSNVPQKQFYSTQNIVSPDINTYYTRVIKNIDAFRSRFNATTSNIAKNISLQDLDTVFANNESNSTSPQESRCNAFYRMMGLPVISGDGALLYSPGFDPDLNRDKDRIQNNLKIANSAIEKFKILLNAREIYPKNIGKWFQVQDANASALAISAIFPRSFGDQVKDPNPLSLDTQLFVVQDRSLVKVNFQNQLNTIIENQIVNSYHILKPFIVDPRIELTVTPGVNRICAPFLLDKSKTQLSKNNYLQRPYIEKIIRVRFNNKNILAEQKGKEEINKYVNEIINFAKNNTDITDTSIIDNLGNSLNNLHKSEIVNFNKLIKVLEAFVLELVNCIIQINRIRTFINWKPIPNINGPELGSVLNKVDVNDTANNQKIEKEISKLEIKKILGTTDFNVGLNNTDLGNFIFSDIDDIVFDTVKHNTEFFDKQLNKLNRQRDEWGNQANELLKKVEIITGEFSGLGLLDIVSIQAALWIISPEALLGLIDNYAFERMQTNQELKTNVKKLSPIMALTEFEKKLSEVYVLIGHFYNNALDADKKKNQ